MQSGKAQTLTDIILSVFRVNGRLLEAGDALVKPLRLTSARWQVIGAVALAGKPLTVPQIALAMGVTRQGVQKQANVLIGQGLMELTPNPGHKRSPLLSLTPEGTEVYHKVDALYSDWAERLAGDLSAEDMRTTLRTLENLRVKLTAMEGV